MIAAQVIYGVLGGIGLAVFGAAVVVLARDLFRDGGSAVAVDTGPTVDGSPASGGSPEPAEQLDRAMAAAEEAEVRAREAQAATVAARMSVLREIARRTPRPGPRP